MTTILRIDGSSRPGPALAAGAEASFSRTLADALLEHLTNRFDARLDALRDLAANPIPAISDATIKGFYTPPEAMNDELLTATALSDTLIAEIEGADILLISTPIYNFSVPAALKAWIDQIVRIGRTFAYEDGEFRGLVKGKRAYVAYAYGAPGYGEGGPLQAYDHMKPYLTMILTFIGIDEVESFAIEGTTGEAGAVEVARAAALASLEQHFAAQEAVSC